MKTGTCPCCKECENCPGFQKVLERPNSGFILYRHVTHVEDINKKTGVVEATTNTIDDVFIIENTKGAALKKIDFTPEIDRNQISCPRCVNILKHAQNLFKNQEIGDNDVTGVCGHCRQKSKRERSCLKCDEIVEKFQFSKIERKQTHAQRVKTWLSKIQQLITLAIDEDKGKKTGSPMRRGHSDIDISKLFRKVSETDHEPEIEDLILQNIRRLQTAMKGPVSERSYFPGAFKEVAFSEPGEKIPMYSTPQEDFQPFLHLQSNATLTEDELEKDFIRKYGKSYKERRSFEDPTGKVRSKDERNIDFISSTGVSYDDVHGSKDHEDRKKSIADSDYPHEDGRRKEVVSTESKHYKSDKYGQDDRNRDFLPAPKARHEEEMKRRATASESQLGRERQKDMISKDKDHRIGQKGEPDTKILFESPSHIKKYHSEESLVTGISKMNEEMKKNKTFVVYFPEKSGARKKKPRIGGAVSSAELIKDTMDKIKTKAEKEKSEREQAAKMKEERQKKLEEEKLEKEKMLAEKMAAKSAREAERGQKEKEKEKVSEQQDTSKRDQDALKKEQDKSKKDKDAIKKEQDSSKKDKDALKKEQDTSKKDKDALKKEQDISKKDKDALKKEKDSSKKYQDALKRDKDISKKDQDVSKKKTDEQMIKEKKAKENIIKETDKKGKEAEVDITKRNIEKGKETKSKGEDEKAAKIKAKEEKFSEEKTKDKKVKDKESEITEKKDKETADKQTLTTTKRDPGGEKLLQQLDQEAKEREKLQQELKQQKEDERRLKLAAEQKAKEDANQVVKKEKGTEKSQSESKKQKEEERRLKLEAEQKAKEDSPKPVKQEKEIEPPKKLHKLSKAKILDLYEPKYGPRERRKAVSPVEIKMHKGHRSVKEMDCTICDNSDLELDLLSLLRQKQERERKKKGKEAIIGETIHKFKTQIPEPQKEEGIKPTLFQKQFETFEQEIEPNQPSHPKLTKPGPEIKGKTKGVSLVKHSFYCSVLSVPKGYKRDLFHETPLSITRLNHEP